MFISVLLLQQCANTVNQGSQDTSPRINANSDTISDVELTFEDVRERVAEFESRLSYLESQLEKQNQIIMHIPLNLVIMHINLTLTLFH